MRPWPARIRTTPEHPDTPLQEGPQAALLAVRLGDHALPHRDRPETTGLQLLPQPVAEPLDPKLGLDRVGSPAVDPSRAGTLVAPHPIPRHQHERGIADKVVQIIKPAMRVIAGPAVQLGLDLSYPALGSEQPWHRITGIHRRPPSIPLSFAARLAGPLGPATGSPGLHDGSLLPRLLRGLRPARGHQLTTSLPACRAGDPEGRAATSGSHVHLTTVRRARCPAPAPAASPRLRRSPSPQPPHRQNQPASELTPPPSGDHALHPGPYPPDLSRWNSYGALTTDFSRAPSRLACRTRTVWQYRYVPSLSGLLPPSPAPPGSGFPQLQPGRCDDPAAESSHLRTVMKRLVAHGFRVPHV